MHKLPPLTSLRAFEAAARLGGFKQAAEELNVTPSAVSHQIRALEEWFATELFYRRTRRVELTAAGSELLVPVSGAMTQLAEACQRIAQRPLSRRLTLSVAHTFANGWLVSRLPAFQLARPDIDVRLLLASTQLEQHFADPEVDVAIAHGREQAVRGVCSHALMTEEVTPVASPALVERERLRHPADLARVALLQVIPRLGQWRAWMAAAKLERVDPDRGPQFQSTPLALEAAMAGAGVAIANRRFVQPHLDSGRLVVAFDVPLPTDVGYYLLYRSARSDETSIAGFRDWLLSALDAERVPEVDGPHLDDAH